MLTSRSSLPTASPPPRPVVGRPPWSAARTALLVPSRCLRKYSLPLLGPEQVRPPQSQHRGQFSGASGSSIANLDRRTAVPRLTYSGGRSRGPGLPQISIGFRLKLGTDGIHPERADCAIVSIMDRFSKRPPSQGARGHPQAVVIPPLVGVDVPVTRCRSSAGRALPVEANARFAQPVIGRTFSCPT